MENNLKSILKTNKDLKYTINDILKIIRDNDDIKMYEFKLYVKDKQLNINK